ncbi:hypothetical protein ACFLSS_02320 [Bacteroidota bacterium]
MKIVLICLLCIITIGNGTADDKYEKEMNKNISKISECKTTDDYIRLANRFERVALAEKEKWLPFYYSSFIYVLACYADSSNDQKDLHLNKSVSLIEMADSLDPKNSEIYTLKGMISQARMQVDPMNRWQKYGIEADKNFKFAVEIDSLNPRPDYLIGIGLYYTPKQFGGGPEAAKPMLEKSMSKFEQFKPANDIMPDWGKNKVEKLLNEINSVSQ